MHPLRPHKTLLPPVYVALLLLTAGCSFGRSGDLPETGEVTGVVTFEGRPLNGANVLFQPKNGRPSMAETDAEGRYTLRYNEQVNGAKLGRHTVRISKLEETRDASGEVVHARETLPAKYNVDTELEANVEAGKNEIDFAL